MIEGERMSDKFIILWERRAGKRGKQTLYYRGGSARTGWPWMILRSAAVEFDDRESAEKALATLKRTEPEPLIRNSLRIEEG